MDILDNVITARKDNTLVEITGCHNEGDTYIVYNFDDMFKQIYQVKDKFEKFPDKFLDITQENIYDDISYELEKLFGDCRLINILPNMQNEKVRQQVFGDLKNFMNSIGLSFNNGQEEEGEEWKKNQGD